MIKGYRNPYESTSKALGPTLGLTEPKTGKVQLSSACIVAIHGLDGHRVNSWTGKNGKLWLRDFLPNKIPHARIMTYGYDARTHGNVQPSDQTIEDHGKTLVLRLTRFRRETNTLERPIIFVAHSLGGIVLKCALNYSHYINDKSSSDHRSISLSTSGIIFLGTPHHGVHIAELASMLLRIRGFVQKVDNKMLNDLRPDSVILQRNLHQFIGISESFDTKLFYEIYPINVSGISKVLVPKSSAVIEGLKGEVISLAKNHIEMAKFDDEEDDDYKTIAAHLRHMSGEAHAKIFHRWAEYKTKRIDGPMGRWL